MDVDGVLVQNFLPLVINIEKHREAAKLRHKILVRHGPARDSSQPWPKKKSPGSSGQQKISNLLVQTNCWNKYHCLFLSQLIPTL